MRKIFTFLFAALMSASMFADPNILTPTISGDLSFTESTTVTMECASPNSDIYYTTDGVTDPRCDCAAAPEYKKPITITETTIIKAAAYDGDDWSAVAEVTFTKVPAPAKYYIVGNMTNWEVNEAYEMSLNELAEAEEYSFRMHLTTGNQFKVVKVEGGNQTWYPDGMGNNYGENGEITSEANYNIYFRPNADGDEAWFYNLILVERRIVIEPVVFSVKVPENGKPESIEIIGDFGEGWEKNGVVLEPNGDWYRTDALFADEYDEFKIRGAGSWDNEIYVRTETGWTVSQNFRFGALWKEGTKDETPIRVIELDLSGENYGWKQSVQSIDNINLKSEIKNHKLVVDGVIYIVRDGKLFNAQGAQVR